MSPITEFMDLLSKTVEDNCDIDFPVSLEELPAKGGLYAESGVGFTQSLYGDKTGIKVIPVLFLSRNAYQRRGMEQLEEICNYLQRRKEYPSGELFTWLDAEIEKEPSKIGRDEDGVYHHSAILNCKLFY